MANHSHRAGRLKQQNKKNKRSAASKRSLGRRAGAGKVAGTASGVKGVKAGVVSAVDGRANRLNSAKQRREASRKTKVDAHRRLPPSSTSATAAADVSPIRQALATISTAQPPRIVGIISLSDTEGQLEELVRNTLSLSSEDGDSSSSAIAVSSSSLKNGEASNSIVTVKYNDKVARAGSTVTLLTNTSSFRDQYVHVGYGNDDASIQGALDLCRVCDLILFLIDGSAATASSNVSREDGSASCRGDGESVSGTSTATTTTTAYDTDAKYGHLVSERGERTLTAIKAQGLPTPVTIIVHSRTSTNSIVDVGGGGEDRPIVGRHVGSSCTTDGNDDVMNDDDDDVDEEEVVMNDTIICDRAFSRHSTATTSQRSAKSLRKSQLRRRADLKRYVTRFASTEFGERGSKVMEIDIAVTSVDENTNVSIDEVSVEKSSRMEYDDDVCTISSTAATTEVSIREDSNRTSVAALIRLICTVSASGPNWVADAPRPYIITDGSIASSSNNIKGVQYDSSSRELQLTGYIRGNVPMNVNQLIHVPHLGTFPIKDVRLAGVPSSVEKGGGSNMVMLPPIISASKKKTRGIKDVDSECGGAAEMVLAKSNVEERESVEMFASPDALEGEQNLIGFDEDDDRQNDDDDDANIDQPPAFARDKSFQPGTSRPAGWSDYQSAWLDALDGNDEEVLDHGELAFALNKKTKDDVDTVMGDDDDDGGVNAEERRALLAQRRRAAKGDLQFPDEVEYEEETSARDRYARYRALKSFRKSHWDPKENLPETYAAVYHFASFKATQRDVMADVRGLEDVIKRRGWGVGVNTSNTDIMEQDDSDDDDAEEIALAGACVPSGSYVMITLEGVSPAGFAGLSPHALISAVSLLPHENKVSVLHMGLSTTSSKLEHGEDSAEAPVKSKDVLTFRCGWRTWQSRPVFSQHNLNSDKHKFERFMPAGGNGATFFAGSVFGPVTYAPCPVMMFRETSSGRREFLALGTMMGADADRIVLKRIVLTGYPTRVHKRHATVKYMFYNPEDVKWFMPAGITTKHGLQGNIIQSVGDHGVMKCLFNAPIKQHDTVVLPLYKRVFPKFAPVVASTVDDSEASTDKHFRVL